MIGIDYTDVNAGNGGSYPVISSEKDDGGGTFPAVSPDLDASADSDTGALNYYPFSGFFIFSFFFSYLRCVLAKPVPISYSQFPPWHRHII